METSEPESGGHRCDACNILVEPGKLECPGCGQRRRPPGARRRRTKTLLGVLGLVLVLSVFSVGMAATGKFPTWVPGVAILVGISVVIRWAGKPT